MSNDKRGEIIRQGAVLRIDNALVEEVSFSDRRTGSILISYSAPQANGTTLIQLLRLNVSGNTAVIDSRGIPVCFCELRKGMWINAVFSPAMTRSIPPQSNAFLIVIQRRNQTPVSVTTAPVAEVDTRNNFLYTGNPNNINRQMRFVITDSTVISGRNGAPLRLNALRPGQVVRVTHANFQTASIPPQTTAFHVQVL